MLNHKTANKAELAAHRALHREAAQAGKQQAKALRAAVAHWRAYCSPLRDARDLPLQSINLQEPFIAAMLRSLLPVMMHKLAQRVDGTACPHELYEALLSDLAHPRGKKQEGHPLRLKEGQSPLGAIMHLTQRAQAAGQEFAIELLECIALYQRLGHGQPALPSEMSHYHSAADAYVKNCLRPLVPQLHAVKELVGEYELGYLLDCAIEDLQERYDAALQADQPGGARHA